MTPIVSSDNNEATVLFPWGTITIRNNPPAQPPKLDAGPGATVRSYIKIKDGKTQKGDQFALAGTENWIAAHSGLSVSRFTTLKFRRPIDSPAQETPQPPEEKPLIVEAGKRYWRRNGTVSEVIKVNAHSVVIANSGGDSPYVFNDGSNMVTIHGVSYVGGNSPCDLVSEYIEPEVTRLEFAAQCESDFVQECFKDEPATYKLSPLEKRLDGRKALEESLKHYGKEESEPSPGEGWRWLVPVVDVKQENDEICIGKGIHWTEIHEDSYGEAVTLLHRYRRNLAYEGLDQLPDGYREAAKANWDRDWESVNQSENAACRALCNAFFWSKTPEGQTFWNAVYAAGANRHPFPPLPLYSIVNGKLTCPKDGTGTTREQAIADNITRLETELEAARKIK